MTSAITIDPARRSGEPCLAGTRLTCEHVASCIDAEGSVDLYIDAYDLGDIPRRSILCAAAYWVITDRSRDRRSRDLRVRWAEWARRTWDDAWNTIEPVPLDDPPL